MPAVTIRPAVSITIQLPTPGATGSQFWFEATVHTPGHRPLSITGAGLSGLLPDLAPHLLLHKAAADGTPDMVESRAWYHLSGLIFPGRGAGDAGPVDEVAARLRAVLRTTTSRTRDIIARADMLASELPDPDIVRAEVRRELFELQPVWRHQADAALEKIPGILLAEYGLDLTND